MTFAIAWALLRRGLGFFAKPPGLYIGLLIAAALGLWWFGHLKYAAGVAAAAVAAAARSAKVKAKQTAAISAANDRAAARAVESAKKDAETQRAVEDAKKAAANMPGADEVAITSAVADRLRDIH